MNGRMWIAIAGLALAIIGAVLSGIRAFGQLEGKVDALDPTAIQKALDEAIADIRREVPVYGDEPRSFDLVVPPDGQVHEKSMIPVSEGICYLTRFRGRFQGGGEDVGIVIRGNLWYLRGGARQPDVKVYARCWKWPTLHGSST